MKKALWNEVVAIAVMGVPIAILTNIATSIIYPIDPVSTAFIMFLISIFTLMETLIIEPHALDPEVATREKVKSTFIFISTAALWEYQALSYATSQPALAGSLLELVVNTVLLILIDVLVLLAIFRGKL